MSNIGSYKQCLTYALPFPAMLSLLVQILIYFWNIPQSNILTSNWQFSWKNLYKCEHVTLYKILSSKMFCVVRFVLTWCIENCMQHCSWQRKRWKTLSLIRKKIEQRNIHLHCYLSLVEIFNNTEHMIQQQLNYFMMFMHFRQVEIFSPSLPIWLIVSEPSEVVALAI